MAYQTNPVCIWIFVDIFRQDSIRHPLRDKLQGNLRNADESNNIWMPQPFPHDRLIIKYL